MHDMWYMMHDMMRYIIEWYDKMLSYLSNILYRKKMMMMYDLIFSMWYDDDEEDNDDNDDNEYDGDGYGYDDETDDDDVVGYEYGDEYDDDHDDDDDDDIIGDQRTNVKDFFVDQEVCHEDQIVIHGG